MDATKTNPTAGTPAGKNVAPTVAAGNPQGQLPSVGNGTGAQSLAVANGGQPGGKPRKDGLRAGSPEAAEADRKYEREKKARQRAQARGAQPPPPLPPTRPAPVVQGPAPGQVDGAALDTEVAPFIEWQSADLSPCVLDCLGLWEEMESEKIEKKLHDANIPTAVQKEVMEAVPFPKRAKENLSRHGGGALAKALNAVGLSSTHKDIINVIPSLAFLLRDRAKLHKRLDALIVAANPAPTQPGQSPKKP